MPTASRPGGWINALFPKGPTARQLETHRNIWWRVCLMHIPPRNERFDYERDMGMGFLDAIMEHKPFSPNFSIKDGQRLFFVFPERWLTTQEEYMFVPMLQSHPQIMDKKLSVIDLVTKSPLIVGNFLAEDIRIVKFADNPDAMGISQASSEAHRIAEAKRKIA